jgi:hypothetical protein
MVGNSISSDTTTGIASAIQMMWRLTTSGCVNHYGIMLHYWTFLGSRENLPLYSIM